MIDIGRLQITDYRLQKKKGYDEPMKKQVNQSVWKLAPVRVSSYPVRQKSVVCVLYRIGYRNSGSCRESRMNEYVHPSLYAIGMDNGEDKDLCLVGNDLHAATMLYHRLVQMAVTPCTLSDIVSDYLEDARI